MTKLLLIFVPTSGTRADGVLLQLEALTSASSCIVDGPLELEGPVPSTDAERLARAAEICERAARGVRIREGMSRARAEGRRLGRPPTPRCATGAEIVLARGSGASWGKIGHKYGLPRTSARRLYQNELAARAVLRPRRREARRP